ncbi:IclR family transcriptional regulator [Streptosporangium saharense]|uniref:IclR family transcriptional regulator n=1 Tax=Streptosporangium saharense TaxID=1706840 RepID=UPI0036B91967
MADTSKTVEKAIRILEELGASQWSTPQELSTRLGLSRTVVQRLLLTLHQREFVTRENGLYRLSTRLRVIADVVLRKLRAASHNVVRELSEDLRETVVLYVADGADVVVLDEALTAQDHLTCVRHEVGARVGMLSSAGGLALLSGAESSTRTWVLRASGAGDEIAAELTAIEEQGFVAMRDRPYRGISSLAVPIIGPEHHAVASLAVLAPTARVSAVDNALPRVRRATTRIADVLKRDAAHPQDS